MTNEGQTANWINAARDGDHAALAKLLALYHPVLLARVNARLGAGLRLRTSADDLLQEVYLQVFRQIGQFEPRGADSFLNWVLTILDHKLIDVQRAAHRQQRDVDREVPLAAPDWTNSCWNLLDQLYGDSTTPSRIVRRDEALGALMTCLGTLLEPQRQVIELRFLQGLSVAEVARRLEKSEDAIVALTQRALKSLREALDRRGDYTRL